ncbi:MAG TPA: hypothetical protein PKL65_00055 [Bacteroidales bacterium]|nr:hypothetical protein [Bacteroidales bacterium]HPM18467.1 hypothetical protein [Bacteroidales bacterium]
MFLQHPDALDIAGTLSGSGLVFDVDHPLNPGLQYIHKVVEGKNVFFFANTGEAPVQTEATLRDAVHLEEWDPHSGTIREADYRFAENASGSESTVVTINLKPYNSVFFIEK